MGQRNVAKMVWLYVIHPIDYFKINTLMEARCHDSCNHGLPRFKFEISSVNMLSSNMLNSFLAIPHKLYRAKILVMMAVRGLKCG